MRTNDAGIDEVQSISASKTRATETEADEAKACHKNHCSLRRWEMKTGEEADCA